VVRLENLSKRFRGRQALEPLTLEIPRGEIVGLLGHNGAGKSTTFGMILGQVHPSTGEVFVEGASVQRERARALARVGAIFETPSFYTYLSGWTNLRIFAAYSAKVDRAELEAAVRLVGMEKRIHDPVSVYSHGMRQRLALAQALVPAPSFLLLDEPTEGLDPEGIHEMRNLILRLREERGMTVLLASHLLAEVEHLCDRVAVLKMGRLLFSGRWQDTLSPRVYRIVCADMARANEVIARCGLSLVGEGTYAVPSELDPAALLEALVGARAGVTEFAPERPSLEAFYLSVSAAEGAGR